MDIIDTEKRLNDAIKNGTEADVNYWRGYLDAVKAMRSRGKEVSGPCTTSNRLQEISQAEMDGRLVVLPCDIGDNLWYIHNGGIYQATVHEISISPSGEVALLFGGWPAKAVWGCNIGKTVFLTLEAAKEALKKEADNG